MSEENDIEVHCAEVDAELEARAYRWSEEERQEALSHRYVNAARVVKLSSGRFAVFTMTSGQIMGVAEESNLATLVAQACAESAATWERGQAALRLKDDERKLEPIKVEAANADALGL